MKSHLVTEIRSSYTQRISGTRWNACIPKPLRYENKVDIMYATALYIKGFQMHACQRVPGHLFDLGGPVP